MASDLLRVASTVRIGEASIPLLSQANVWIDDSLADDSSIKLTQSVMDAALKGTAPGQLEVIVYDDGLSGLAAPFASLNKSGEKILTILSEEQDFKASLKFLRDQVQGVKNVMQGKAATLAEYRTQVGYPVEGYKLVVVSTDFSMLDADTQGQLAVLFKAGPAAGVSFLIHSMVNGANPYVLAFCYQLAIRGGVVQNAQGLPINGWAPPGPSELMATADNVADSLAHTAMANILFTGVQDVGHPWSSTSEDGVTFSIGKYGDQIVEITLGDELNQRHNMLVTGAVGQGKSNLISVIIHSLCQRYSPSEVQLYLLDFKEGITLQAFFNETTGEYLPQARVLGLEADREFGLSVLRGLFDIYKTRMRTFKDCGVQNIRQYRQVRPNEAMPRIIVIIDEFQMMFAERDKVSDEIADLLVRGVRLFRACGIHVILASQTIGGNVSLMGSAGEGLFGQVPVRVALKNSLSESHATLSDRNDGATHLRAREAIVNSDYGELTANKKTSIAFADEAVLAPLRKAWWQARGSVPAPYVFQGEKRRSLAADGAALAALRQNGKLSLLLGSRIEVDARPLELSFGRDVGRNVAMLGAGEALPEIANMALSLAAQKPGLNFVVLNFLDDNPEWNAIKDPLGQALTRSGAQFNVTDKTGAVTYIGDLAASLDSRTAASTETILLGLGMDRCRTMPMEFQDLVKSGPAVGVHVIGWWLKMDSFREQVGYGGDAFFDTRLALRLDSQSAKQLMADPLLDWKPVDNRMLVWDASELPEAIRIIPYTIFDGEVPGSTARGI